MVFKIINFIILKLEFNLLLLLLLLLLLYVNSLLSHHVNVVVIVVVVAVVAVVVVVVVVVIVVGGVSRTDVIYFPFGQTVPRICGYAMFEKKSII